MVYDRGVKDVTQDTACGTVTVAYVVTRKLYPRQDQKHLPMSFIYGVGDARKAWKSHLHLLGLFNKAWVLGGGTLGA